MQTIINVGFIGAGKSTHRYQAPFILRRSDKFKIKTIWARNLDHISWERIENVNYTDNIDELLNDQDISLVVISTPVMHYEYAKMALEHGKNVVCEKPFTNTYKQAETLFEIAKKNNVKIMCIQNRRFDSDFLTTKKVIDSNILGDLLEVEMHYDYYRPYVSEKTDYFDPYAGYLYGHACHTLDQAISYFGIPDDYHLEVRQLLGEGRMNDYFDIDLFYKQVKVSIKSSYFRVKSRPRFVAYGKRGMFIKESEDRQEYDLKRFYMPTSDHPDFGMDREEHYGEMIYYDEHGEYHKEKVPTINGDYSRYYDEVYEMIINDKEPLVKPYQTLFVMKLLEEGIKQCK